MISRLHIIIKIGARQRFITDVEIDIIESIITFYQRIGRQYTNAILQHFRPKHFRCPIVIKGTVAISKIGVQLRRRKVFLKIQVCFGVKMLLMLPCTSRFGKNKTFSLSIPPQTFVVYAKIQLTISSIDKRISKINFPIQRYGYRQLGITVFVIGTIHHRQRRLRNCNRRRFQTQRCIVLRINYLFFIEFRFCNHQILIHLFCIHYYRIVCPFDCNIAHNFCRIRLRLSKKK